MRLLIVRHAIAVPRGTPGIEDDERPLTRRGIARFRTAARGLARSCRRPDVLLTSPLIRARQTAEIAAKAWGKIHPETLEALGSGSVSDIVAALETHRDKDLVAIVGHEPDLSELLARLLGTKAADRLTFKKGGAALVEIPGPFADGGTLLWYAPPRLLRGIR
jgi:phosphohistidine phosphatase